MQALGRHAYSVAQTPQQALQRASGLVDDLLSGDWTGDAAQSFGDGRHECSDGGSQLCTTLTAMADKLGINADTFHMGDQATGNSFTPGGLV